MVMKANGARKIARHQASGRTLAPKKEIEMDRDAEWCDGLVAEATALLAAFNGSYVEPKPARVTQAELAAMIDHTILKPDATPDDVATICREAVAHEFASVCVNACHVPQCAELLAGEAPAVCSVVGFPLGATLTEAKAYEADLAIAEGATEIDMVINVGLLKSRDLRRRAR